MSDFRIAGELPKVHSLPGPSWFPSALSRNAALHTSPHLFSSSFQRLHPHSFIPHPCSSPGPPSTSCPLSPSSPIPLTLLLPVLSHLPKMVTPLCPFPSLSLDQNFPSVSHSLCASSLNPCLHTQSLYICVFTLSNLSPLTTFILLGPTPSSFLPASQWHISDSFLPPNPSCWLLLPNTRSVLATDISFLCPFLIPLIFFVP